jgi:hypothetical protein
VPVNSAWLGLAQLLPRFSAPGSRELLLVSDKEPVALSKNDEVWNLPLLDVEGSAELLVRYDDEEDRVKQFDFVLSPDSERYRPVTHPDSWVIEGAARSFRFSQWSAEYGMAIIDMPDVADRVYLGRDVGIFNVDATSAAWEIKVRGNNTRVRPLVPTSDLIPIAASSDHGDRRRWRRLLSTAAHDQLDADALRALHLAVGGNPGALQDCSPSPSFGLVPDLVSEESPDLDRAIASLVAILNNQKGIERWQLIELLVKLLGVDGSMAAQICRAWQETEMLDELVNTRWSGRRVFARSPSLIIYQVGQECRGLLRGLTLRSTREELCSSAHGVGIESMEVGSFSPYVPRALLLYAEDIELLKQLADRHNLRYQFLRADPFAILSGRDLTDAIPSGYSAQGMAVDLGDGLPLQRWVRRGSPSFWTIESPAQRLWTHFFEAARFWGSILADVEPVISAGRNRLDYQNAYLPLSAARWVSSLGGVLPGPLENGGAYSYGLPSSALQRQICEGLIAFAHSADL